VHARADAGMMARMSTETAKRTRIKKMEVMVAEVVR